MNPNQPDPVRPGPARLRAPHPRQHINTDRLRRKVQRSQASTWDGPQWHDLNSELDLDTEGGADRG